MANDDFFRWAGTAILVGTVVTSGFYRARADRAGGKLPAKPEGLPATSIRVAIGFLVLAALLLPIVAPSAARWITVRLPFEVRLVGLGLAAAAWPLLWWTLASIGTNISPSISTRDRASLVTHGPYRFVRHPLYTGGFLALLGAGLCLQSVPLLLSLPFLIGWLPRRASQEEANLTAAHGEAYREYAGRTGRFIPQVFAKR